MNLTPKPLHIEGEMTIYRAGELREQLQLLLDTPAPARIGAIDLSGVTEIDCSGVQLLLSACQAAADAGHELQLVNPSTSVSGVLAMLNLDAHPVVSLNKTSH